MGNRIIIAGGGTGGHIFPAVAIANALKKIEPGIALLFVGATGKMEMQRVPDAGYEIRGINIAGFNRSSLLKNIGLPFKLIRSFLQVKRIVSAFKPDAAVGVGGYSTYPVLRYAQSKGIATFIHESNSFAGKSNKLLAKRAAIVFTASDNMEQFFPKDRLRYTGNPVRKNIIDRSVSHEQGVIHFGLDPHKKTILAIGGSLGARSINDALASKIEEINANGFQLIWQTGKTGYEKYKAIADGKKNIRISEFISEMEFAYAAADVIISRSGSTVYELSVIGKPAVLVPYPFAAEDHQTANALNLVRRNAALMVRDSEAVEALIPTVIKLIKDDQLQQQLSRNIASLAITNADETIAREILNFINHRQQLQEN